MDTAANTTSFDPNDQILGPYVMANLWILHFKLTLPERMAQTPTIGNELEPVLWPLIPRTLKTEEEKQAFCGRVRDAVQACPCTHLSHAVIGVLADGSKRIEIDKTDRQIDWPGAQLQQEVLEKLEHHREHAEIWSKVCDSRDVPDLFDPLEWLPKAPKAGFMNDLCTSGKELIEVMEKANKDVRALFHLEILGVPAKVKAVSVELDKMLDKKAHTWPHGNSEETLAALRLIAMIIQNGIVLAVKAVRGELRAARGR